MITEDKENNHLDLSQCNEDSDACSTNINSMINVLSLYSEKTGIQLNHKEQLYE